jgi:hypothetical protein
MYTLEQIKKAVKAKGYVWFDSDTNYDLNIVGVRTSSTGKKVTNLFDDFITVSYKLNGEQKFHSWSNTTDPGTKAVKELHNPNGVARLVPGQYRSSHEIGLHQGKYEALKQLNPVKVYRDANKDEVFDENKVQEGIFGINIHRSNPKTESTFVENWSEGCQVFKKVKDFNEFLAICKQGSKVHGNKFTYTLIESKDIV